MFFWSQLESPSVFLYLSFLSSLARAACLSQLCLPLFSFACPLPVACLSHTIVFWSQLCLPLFSSTCLHPVTCLGSVIFLGFNFLSLCFPLLVALHSALSPFVLSTCPLPVACLGRVMLLGSQLCLPLFSSTCLHPVTCLGSVIFLGFNFICFCFPLLVKYSSFVFLYLSVSCHLLGRMILLRVNIVCLSFLLFVQLSSFVLLYLSPSCHLLGPHDFLLEST